MEDFILQVEVDVCSRSFNLISDNGDIREVKCDTVDEFMRVLRVCDELLDPIQIVYKDCLLYTSPSPRDQRGSGKTASG